MKIVPQLSARATPLSIPASPVSDTDATDSSATITSSAAAAPPPLIAPRLLIEFDAASDRFVHTLIDPASQSVLRRFPNEGQIAFSRGVNAYVQAMRQK